MAKYRALTGSESLLQRHLKDGSLHATRKAEAEAYADNWIDRELSDWENSRIAASGAIPPQVDELAALVATARYIELDQGALGRSPAKDEDSIVASLMREARAIADKIKATGFIHGAHGERIERVDPNKSDMHFYLRF